VNRLLAALFLIKLSAAALSGLLLGFLALALFGLAGTASTHFCDVNRQAGFVPAPGFKNFTLFGGWVLCARKILFWHLTRHQHPHRFMLALARVAGPLAFLTTPPIRAQKDFFRAASALLFGFPVTGGFNLLPVARFSFARPLAVSPAPRLAGNFSPLPTLSDGDRFFAIT
jgi:hypothetical protein